MTIGNRPALVRGDGRAAAQLRPISLKLDVQKWAEGSCLIRVGDTEVLCAATIADRVPPHLRGKGTGWVTAEYSMLPRATSERTERESSRGRVGGRTHEIQRLIGRSLRGVVDLGRLGERTVTVDCDVLQADGGTRTASITGGYVALGAALIRYGMERLLVSKIAAVSVGIVDGVSLLDLDYCGGFAGRGGLQRRGHRRRDVRRARRAPPRVDRSTDRPSTASSTSRRSGWSISSPRRPRRSRRFAAERHVSTRVGAAPARRRHPLGAQASRAAGAVAARAR